MSSSDSEDDCYGNIAQKLQRIKSSIVKEKVENVVLSDHTEVAKTREILSNNVEDTPEIIVEDLNTTVNSTDNDEYSLDAIIAKNSKVKPRGRGRGRGNKRKSTSETSEHSGPSERETRATRRRTSNSTRGRTSPAPSEPSTTCVDQNIAASSQINDSIEEVSCTRGRGGSARGRGRTARARGSRGRARGRGRTRRELWAMFDEMFENRLLTNAIFGSSTSNSSSSNNYPTYSVGNTDEYPDQSDSQQLFSTRPVSNDVEVIEDEDPLDDDNEEMSVKVYWQSLEIFKFKIRKYQKLTQIFDYFTAKEGVSKDNLLFTYNERILKIDDTPDSINYSIAKFIDGGIVNQSVTQLAQECNKEDENSGLKLKFQCQNKKKPFETTLRPQDKLALAMMKCAEHLETPIERLKFYFDGDLITSKTTPQDLELEGGECIDVKIINS
ncbi:hypothetical protein PYW08_011142 [Mythimna loreyi]|uniref:Uncharacterized protein n=1 Tax=Mythimna loreyi TaxID=667449 RepID=A0ACC2Q7I6_9NEOP|nr:hypothetical protein PYW08_011142 [Mythimna loreyi]